LSRVQSLLSRADNEPITLGALIGMELEAVGFDRSGDRIVLGGPEAPLRKSAVEMLSLAIHELLTNAIKYGALASPTGRLSVTWWIDGFSPDRRLVLEWNEYGVALPPRSADSVRNGYGRTLIEEALPYSLSAETKFEFAADGLRCRIRLPLAPSDTGAGRIRTVMNGAAFAGRRVLVVEDNFNIAFAMARILEAHGAEPIGPVATVQDALALIEGNERIDGAALDVNLRGKMVYPVANVLRAKNVPMVFMTGYDDQSIDPGYANVPRVQKPVTVERLMQVLFG
jgi:CheY-like chemotaxis protein